MSSLAPFYRVFGDGFWESGTDFSVDSLVFAAAACFVDSSAAAVGFWAAYCE